MPAPSESAERRSQRDNVGGGTKLQGGDLTDATTEGAKFDGAQYDADTVFPAGFDRRRMA
jgi:hypothetical protein